MKSVSRGLSSRRLRGAALLVSAALLLFSFGGCKNAPDALKGDQLRQRLRVTKACLLMGEKEASKGCEAARHALIGKSPQTPGDKLAIQCFDHMHASRLTEARKAFNDGLIKEPANPYVLACGNELRRFEKK